MKKRHSTVDAAVTRRRVLRRVAVAGAAGAGAAMLGRSPAHAAPGDAVIMGADNFTGDSTRLSTTSNGPTLVASNPTGPTVEIKPDPSPPQAGAGVLHTNGTGGLGLTGSPGVFPAHMVYTDAVALTTVALPPTRVLDTRSQAGCAHIVDGIGNLDSSGRLRAGRQIIVDLSELSFFSEGVRANVTATSTTGGGYLTVWGRYARPATSSVNWWGAGQTLANNVLAQLGSYEASTGDFFSDVVAIYASSPAAVIMDVSAFIAWAPWYVFPPGATGATSVKAATDPGVAAAQRGLAGRRMPRRGQRLSDRLLRLDRGAR